ncbi:tyrosinase family oxidase copper chaperone [Streptomyces luteolus]|uniref:Tyrosinase family oxidase copper chaperone n=1 Tax=Streptomyces luteolus TaxID=3043615 RepID=A0ABT6T5Q9_9ACTN|nr:tyrosinase family oxidase copper chaperone [Streptomyces sp. B-S-A12]MDI3422723.1 tyrosinase family oxidase copper chaperone [Streptomyces sp. B-S-A12]
MPSRRVLVRSLVALPAAFLAVRHSRHGAVPDKGSGTSLDFDEWYRGRRIQVVAGSGGVPQLLIDRRPLHLMRCADGGYVTPIDHYQSCPTPVSAARAAVDVLGSARLSRYAAAHGGGAEGGTHGVHA